MALLIPGNRSVENPARGVACPMLQYGRSSVKQARPLMSAAANIPESQTHWMLKHVGSKLTVG